MRIVIVGASRIAVATTEALIREDHQLVLVDTDRDKIERISESIDCGMIHGDGTSPEILREAAGDDADVLVALTEFDQTNILAALVGKSIGFARVIPQINNPELKKVCDELDLADAIAPHETIARHLVDSILSNELIDISPVIEGDVRLYAFNVGENGPEGISDLELPERSAVICVYRKGDYFIPGNDTALQQGDRVVVITNVSGLSALAERYNPKP